MRKIITAMYYIIYLARMLILLIIPDNKYTWMQEIDNTMTHLPEDSTSDRDVGIAIPVLILVIMQVVRFQYLKNNPERFFIIELALLSIIVWITTQSLGLIFIVNEPN
ncbi:hypothetical protein [Snodgrassella sp.]|nr:hypothetical protein [Snodgrassella sp.]MCO6519400.1 hypothetical protein [Snodgrassella sp.]